jgi:predicted TIM-barrel fold metal-dependent hydrolase
MYGHGISDNYWNERAEIAIDFLKKNKLGSPTVDEVKNNIMDPMMDADGSKLIANMDASGVDKTFIMAIDWGYGIGEAEKTVDGINPFYGSLAKKYPDRVVAFAGVDPRRSAAVDILDRAVNDYRCRGLNIIPQQAFILIVRSHTRYW